MVLNYKVFGDFGEDVIILHGLLGSLDNWQTVARSLEDTYRIWIFDQRNHGRSPHADEMNYDVMAEDLKDFMSQHEVEHAHIVGHSMGGKVAMTFSLKYPDMVDDLVVIDIGPKSYEGNHIPALKAIISTDVSRYKEREEVEAIISQKVKSDFMTQVIMKNLGRDAHTHFFWRPNADVLLKSYRNLMDSTLGNGIFDKKTSFIKGALSPYIQVEDFPSYKENFSQAQLFIVPKAGHMLHVEQQAYFIDLLMNILGE